MIYIVRVAPSFRQLDQVSEYCDEVFLSEDGVVRRGMDLQPLVDFVPSHPPEIIPLRVEEEPIERRACRLEVGSLSRPQQRVDLPQRLGFAISGVFEQRVL